MQFLKVEKFLATIPLHVSLTLKRHLIVTKAVRLFKMEKAFIIVDCKEIAS